MIDRKPSAVDVAHSSTAPWQSPRYLGLYLVSLSGMRTPATR